MNGTLRTAIATLLVGYVMAATPVSAEPATPQLAGVELSDQVTLVISREPGSGRVLDQFGYEADRATPYLEIITMPAAEAQDLIPHLKLLPDVRAVEEDYQTTYVPPEQMMAATSDNYFNFYELREEFAQIGPSDTHFKYQAAWMKNTKNLQGTSDILRAWKASRRVEKLRIAIVDSGFDDHVDMAWAEGINLFNATTLTEAEDFKQYRTQCSFNSNSNYHGQQVGSIVGATANNAYGTAGMLDATMVAINVAGCEGIGYLTDTALGIRWAAGDPDAGMYPISAPTKIINVSRSSTGSVSTCPTYMQDAVDYATSRGYIVTIAAGNSPEISANNLAPANCIGAITVANIDRNGLPAFSTSRGSAVDISAIGTLVPASSPHGDDETLMFGTSFAAPTVAGALGLLWQQTPELSSNDVIKIAMKAAHPMPNNPVGLGVGVINAHQMLIMASGLLDDTAVTYDHPERAGNVTPGLANYLERKGVMPGACQISELDVTADLEPDEYIVVYKVPASRDLHRQNGSIITTSEHKRQLIELRPDGSDRYGFQVCEDAAGALCKLDALVELDNSSVGQGTNC